MQAPINQNKGTVQFQFSGRKTSAYQFQARFYGLASMRVENQKAIDLTLTNCKNTFVFLDDIRVVTKGKKADHQLALKTVPDKLTEENVATSVPNCNFSCKQVEWLVFTVNAEGTRRLIKKTYGIENLKHPKTYKLLKSFTGSIHYLTIYKRNLAAPKAIA